MTKTDLVWDEIYQRYMTSRLTYRELADQYGVSFSVLCRKGAREHWPQQRRQALRDCANRYTPLCQHEAIIAKKENSVSQEEDLENQLTAPDKKKIRDLSGKDKQIEETSRQKIGRMPAEAGRKPGKSKNLSETWGKQTESRGRRQMDPSQVDLARQEFSTETDRDRQDCPIEAGLTRQDLLSETEVARRNGTAEDCQNSQYVGEIEPSLNGKNNSPLTSGRRVVPSSEHGESPLSAHPEVFVQNLTDDIELYQRTGVCEQLLNTEEAGETLGAGKSGQMLNFEPVKGDLNRESAEQLSKMGKIGQTLSAEAAKEDLNGEDAGLFSKTEKPEPFLNCGAAEKRSKDEGAQPFSTTGEMEPFTNANQTEQPKLFSEQTLSGLRDLLVQQVHTAFLQLGRRAITEKIHVGVVREPAAPGRSGNSRRKADEASTAFSDAAEQAARQGEVLGLEESAAGTAKWKCTYTKDTENIRYVPDDIDVARLKQLSAILRDLYALSDTDNGQKIEVVFAPDTEAWSE